MHLTPRGRRVAVAVQSACQWAAITVVAVLVLGVGAVLVPTIDHLWS